MSDKERLEELMARPYKVEIRKIPESEGGGFCACIPQLGDWAFNGDGETICHFFIKEGKFHYLGDCTHDLKGQVVKMEDVDDLV